MILIGLSCSLLYGQKYTSGFYEQNDPAKDITNPTKKFKIHNSFLKSAQKNSDTLKIILGNLYLSNDVIKKSKYTDAMNYLIKADELALLTKDTFMLGRINHKKGSVYYLLKNIDESIKYYEISLEQSIAAKDSQYIAISLEQLGSLFSKKKNYDKSNKYYERAIPIVKKHCKPKSMTVTLINYGNSLSDQGRIVEAIQVYKMAIDIGIEIGDEYEIYAAKINLAHVYSNSDSLLSALSLYKESMEVYKKNSWLYYLSDAYKGISTVYEKLGKIDSAYLYFQKYHFLKDSVLGVEVQNRIIELEEEAESHRKNNEILTLKEKNLKAQEKLKNIIIGVLILLVIIVWGLWYFYYKTKKAKLSLEENKKALKSLTDLLTIKNGEISRLKSHQERDQKESSATDETISSDLSDINFYDISVLTDQDWQTFKQLFENSYPNYLQRIRTHFQNISEAEERLFIFIKLNISTKEAANILGIQPDTVKKTRTRLKKRLGLDKSQDLNEYIHSF